MTSPEIAADPLPPRIAIISILGFWLLYFTIVTARAFFIYNAHIGILNRCIVSAASSVITYGVYLVLRRVPIAHLRTSILVAALLAAPATFAYSSVNWFVFSRDMPRFSNKTVRRIVITPPASPTPPVMSNGVAPPPAPPPAPTTITVGKMGDDEVSFTPLLEIADQAVNGYFFFICWSALYLALAYAHLVGALERRGAALAAAAQSAELRALRYQVNPHFLFNTLNSLSSLVLTGKAEAAERMIMSLSTFFRTSLAGDTTADVALSEEIRLQRLYLDVEAVRFPARQIVAVDVPENLMSVCVPGLVLQPIVENAVKYGVSRSVEPVTIRIAARDLGERIEIVVEDDAKPLSALPVESGTGVGLRNVCDRLAARYGEAAACDWGPREGGGFSVTLRFPLVRDGC